MFLIIHFFHIFILSLFIYLFTMASDCYIYNICDVLMHIKDRTPPYIPTPEICSLRLSQCACMCHSVFSNAHG